MRLPISRIRLAALVVLAASLPPVGAQFPDEKPRGPMDNVIVDSPELRADLGGIGDAMPLCATLDGRDDALAFLRSDRATAPQSLQRSAARFVGPVIFSAEAGRAGADFTTPGAWLDLKKIAASRVRPGTLRAQAGNDPGRMIAPAPGAPPFPRSVAGPIDPSTQAEASQVMKKHSASLVFVSGTVGAGSGFIGQLRGTTFLFTNAHVAAGVKGAGFKTLEGAQVQLGTPAIAVGHDIFLTTLAPGKPAIEIMIGVDQNAAVGDGVVVLGNAEGGGVINTITGKIVGIGPDRVEVDAPFQPGNSGSPIIHLKSGKVIGVATYLTIKKYDAATKEVLANPVVRRFGYRLDSVKKWEPVAWPAFYAQAGQMEKIEQLTADLEKFLIDIAKDSRVSLGVHNNPAIKSRIDQWQASKKGRSLSSKDMAQINLNFVAFIKSACRSDTTAAQSQMTYDYFQRQLTGEQQIRGEMAEIFQKIIQDIEKDR